jgi:hypothetical protein
VPDPSQRGDAESCQKDMPVMTSFREYIASRKAAEISAEPPVVVVSPLDRALTVTFFADQFTRSKSQETISLRGLVDRLKTTRASTKASLPWLKLAAFGGNRTEKGSLRHDENVLEISGIEADYDGEKITLERAKTVLTGAGIAAILYTSPSHTEDTPRWRILCPTSKQLPPGARAGLVARINGLFVGALAGESFTLSQSYFFGSISGNPSHEVVVVEGKAVDIAVELDTSAIGRSVKPDVPVQRAQQTGRARVLHDGGSAYGLAALERECDAIRTAPDGAKHATLNKAAFSIGGLVTAGALQQGAAFSELSAALQTILPYCKDQRHASNTLDRAFRDGMGQPRDIPEPQPPPVDEIHPAAELIAKAHAIAAKRQSQPIPVAAGLMDVDGILRELVDACMKTAIRPQPFLALGAAICAVGALAGRKYRTKTDLRTNIYAAALCESGGGKDHPSEIVRRCIDAAKLDRYLGGETIASGRAVLSSLESHPAKLFQVDEFGLFLQGVIGKKAAPHKAEIWSELMKLYSRAKGIYRGTEYANKKDNPRIDVHEPCACFFGTTTPLTFWNAVEGGAMADGSLARFLVFITDNHRPDRNTDPGIFTPSPSLLAGLTAISRGPGSPMAPGNLPGVHDAPMIASQSAEPSTVQMTQDADRLHIKNLAREDVWAKKVEGTSKAAIVNRLAENAAKLALISAVSRNPSVPLITERDVAWAWALAEHCCSSFLNAAETSIANTDFESKLNQASNIIRKHGPVSRRDMFHKGFKPNEREWNEVIGTLLVNGVIIEIKSTPGPGRPTIKYSVSGVSQNDTGSGDDE